MADLGSFLGAIVSATGLGIGKSGMHTPTPEQAGANLLREASAAGLSPLALLGNQPTYTGTGATGGDPGVAGQLLARAVHANTPAEDRVAALQEQNMALQNMNLQNDVVFGQLRNAQQRLAFGTPATPPMKPPTFSLDDVWGSVFGPSQLAPKPMLQPFINDKGDLVYGPAAAVQQSLWSPVPGAAANPAVAAAVVRANSAHMPTASDILRSMGVFPGSEWLYKNLPWGLGGGD